MIVLQHIITLILITTDLVIQMTIHHLQIREEAIAATVEIKKALS